MSTTASASMFLLGDIDKLEVQRSQKMVALSSTTSHAIFDDKYFVKMLEVVKDYADSDHAIVPESYRIADMAHEICMMEAAGEDCALQPLGRIILKGNVVGHVTRLGVCYPPHLPEHFAHREMLLGGPSFKFPSAKEFIDDLVALVHRLHAKGVLHGDIKPSNVIYCKQSSRFLFCDLGSAHLANSKERLRDATVRCISPARAHGDRHPLTKEDDLYATGISVWEIATAASLGAFADIEDDNIYDVISSGFQPNIYVVEDVATRHLIRSLLDAGFPQGRAFTPDETCIEGEIVYRDCHADPPHTYTKTVHRSQCGGGVECDKSVIYRIPSVLSHVENVPCGQLLGLCNDVNLPMSRHRGA